MAATSQVAAYLDALYDALALRGGLAGVNLFRYMQKQETLGREFIVLSKTVEAGQSDPFAGNRARDEEVTINGLIETSTPGAGDDVAHTTLARATELLAEIEDAFGDDRTVGNTVRVAHVTGYRHIIGANENGRVHRIEFTHEYSARLVRS